MNLIETLRAQVVKEIVTGFRADWPKRRDVLRKSFVRSNGVTPQQIRELGDHLSESYRVIKGKKTQSGVAHAGKTWERLVIYYLNLCLAGTEAIVLPGKKTPDCIKKALKVTYSSSASKKINSDIDAIAVYAKGIRTVKPQKPTKSGPTLEFAAFAEQNFKDLSVVLFQTKTNWNDTAQPAMLWSLLYKSAILGLQNNGTTFGADGFHLSELKSFLYAFVTVPTNKLELFDSNKTAVIRVNTCSGGAYWGRPTRDNVILSIKEVFDRVYSLSGHSFPLPSEIGKGVERALQAGTSSPPIIDLEAFDLL